VKKSEIRVGVLFITAYSDIPSCPKEEAPHEYTLPFFMIAKLC